VLCEANPLSGTEDVDLEGFQGVCRLFPLPGVVLFPHTVLPLHIFEPRYRQMTAHALAADKLVAIVQVRADRVMLPSGEPALEQVACIGRILAHEQLPDGCYNFLLMGLKRAEIISEVSGTTLYRRARVELLDDIDDVATPEPLQVELTERFRRLLESRGALDPEVGRFLRSNRSLGALCDFLSFTLGLPPALGQRLLAERQISRRAEVILGLLRQMVPDIRPAGGARSPYPPRFSEN
jgi:Lon protease-like protein